MRASTYDRLNGWGPDFAYWLALVDELRPESVCDLGCGTGELSVLMAERGSAVVGVDPDPGMLAVARERRGHERVTWVEAYAAELTGVLAPGSCDLVTMTSHVAQVFLDDAAWLEALGAVHQVLRPGGRVALDLRNRAARGWAAWNPVDSRRRFDADDGPAETWHEVTSVVDGLVGFDTTVRPRVGPDEVTSDVLRFLDEAQLRDSLERAGLRVERLHGDWDGSPVTPASAELIVVAGRD